MAIKPETKFERAFMSDLRALLPGCYIFKLDPVQYYGIPDRLVLFQNIWFTLEFKESATAKKQPLQDHHVEVMNNMSFSAFVYPENREEILDAICHTFGIGRYPRVSQRK